MATKALITKAKGLAMLVALLPLGGGDEVLPAAPVLEPPVAPFGPVAPVVTVAGTEVVTVLALDKVARLKVLLREIGVPVPVPRAPVPTAAVVTLPGTMVVTTKRLLLLGVEMAERREDTNDETDAATEVSDAAEAEVLEPTEEAEDAEIAVRDEATELTDETTSGPPDRENFPE